MYVSLLSNWFKANQLSYCQYQLLSVSVTVSISYCQYQLLPVSVTASISYCQYQLLPVSVHYQAVPLLTLNPKVQYITVFTNPQQKIIQSTKSTGHLVKTSLSAISFQLRLGPPPQLVTSLNFLSTLILHALFISPTRLIIFFKRSEAVPYSGDKSR